MPREPSDPKWRRGEQRRPVLPVRSKIALPGFVADVVREIAAQCELKLDWVPPPMENKTVPPEVENKWKVVSDEHRIWYLVIDGEAGDLLNDLTSLFKDVHVYYCIEGGTLRFFNEAGDLRDPRSEFWELAGRLMHEAPRGRNGRISDVVYRRIIAEIDEAGFKPIHHLEGERCKALRVWNRDHSKIAHHTFLSAYLDPQFNEAVRDTLSRARSKYRRAHPEA